MIDLTPEEAYHLGYRRGIRVGKIEEIVRFYGLETANDTMREAAGKGSHHERDTNTSYSTKRSG